MADAQTKTSKAARVSAGVLLLHEKRARQDISDAVDDATDRVSAELARKRSAHRADALAMVLIVAKGLTTRVHGVIAQNRQAARVASGDRARVELVAAGIVAATLLRGHHLRATEDEAHAESAAASLVAAWRGLAVASVAKGTDAKSLDKLPTYMRPRIARTATNEIAAAYNDEHGRALIEAAQQNPSIAYALDSSRAARVWNAVLDKRTCSECDDLDGTMVEWNEDFPRGEPPIHVNCRCITVFTTSPSLAAAA